MKHFLIFLVLVAGFVGCQNVNKPEKPKDLIGTHKMVDILTEAYLANAARSVNNRLIVSKGIKVDSLVYSKFGVDSLQFVKSNAFYAADINAYMEIFKQVESRLTGMQKKMDSIRETKQILEDSLENKKRNMLKKAAKDSLI